MNAKLRRSRRASRRFVIGICLMVLVVGVAADGPVNIVDGVSVTGDNNDSEGETWGRSGGRTIAYSVGNTSAFDTLWFGATSLPSAAFDGAVDSPLETMSFDTTSDLGGGVARWTGQAVLPLSSPFGSVPINTRFTMTITNASNVGVAMTNFAGGPTPGIDVKTVGNGFNVNLRFEAFIPGGFFGGGTGGFWAPLLDFYDAAPTPVGNPPDQGGPALTGFSRGFYFTNVGLTLEEHDANITAQITALGGAVGSVKNDTAFLKADLPGRFNDLGTAVGGVSNAVINNIQPKLDQIQMGTGQIQGRVNDVFNFLQNMPPIPQIPGDIAKSSEVQALMDPAQTSATILKILIGLEPCPLPPQMCAGLTFLPQLAKQASVDEVKLALNALATQASLDQVNQLLNGLATNANVDEIKAALTELATHAAVEQVKQRLADLASAVDDIKGTLANPANRLELQVVELTESDPGHRRRWLVRTSVNGAPVAGELAGLIAIAKTATTTDVTAMAVATPLLPGLIDVVLDGNKLSDLAFNFSVRHGAGAELMEANMLVGDKR
jgi:hypothetical protein